MANKFVFSLEVYLELLMSSIFSLWFIKMIKDIIFEVKSSFYSWRNVNIPIMVKEFNNISLEKDNIYYCEFLCTVKKENFLVNDTSDDSYSNWKSLSGVYFKMVDKNKKNLLIESLYSTFLSDIWMYDDYLLVFQTEEGKLKAFKCEYRVRFVVRKV